MGRGCVHAGIVLVAAAALVWSVPVAADSRAWLSSAGRDASAFRSHLDAAVIGLRSGGAESSPARRCAVGAGCTELHAGGGRRDTRSAEQRVRVVWRHGHDAARRRRRRQRQAKGQHKSGSGNEGDRECR